MDPDSGVSMEDFVERDISPGHSAWLTNGWKSLVNFSKIPEYVEMTDPTTNFRGQHFFAATIVLLQNNDKFKSLDASNMASLAVLPGQHEIAEELLDSVFDAAIRLVGTGATADMVAFSP